MRARRAFHAELDVTPGVEVELDASEREHLVKVLRLGAGDEVELFDGRGTRVRAVLTRAERRLLAARVEERLPASPPAAHRVEIYVAPPKSSHQEVLVRGLTELGVAALVPLATHRGWLAPRSRDKALDLAARWRRQAIEACKQCGRDLAPVIPDEPAAIDQLPPEAIVLDPRAPLDLPTRLAARPVGQPRRLVLGPEGGFDDEEHAVLAARGALPATLGPSILRVETAALAAATLALHV